MNLTISKKTLEQLLDQVYPVIQKKATLPLVTMAHMSFVQKDDNSLILIKGTDLQTTIITGDSIDAVSNPFAICFDINTMSSLLKSLPEMPLNITVDKDTLKMTVIAEKGVYDIVTMPADDFPMEIKIENPIEFIMTNEMLKRIVLSSSAAANDELRPTMNGVYVEVLDGVMNIISTDANIMFISKYDSVDSQNVSFIIPSTAIKALKSIVDKFDDVTVQVSERNIVIKRGKMKYILRSVDGKYPNYKAVIPSFDINNIKIDVNAKEFGNSIDRLKLVSNTETLKITAQDNTLKIESSNVDLSVSATESLSAEIEGEITFGLMHQKISSVLKMFGKDEIRFHASVPERAILITSECDPTFTGLVMPAMIQQ